MIPRSGRPLRFLAMTLGGWTALRIMLLWPTGAMAPTLIGQVVPVAAAKALLGAGDRCCAAPEAAGPLVFPIAGGRVASLAGTPVADTTEPHGKIALAMALVGMVRFGEPQVADRTPAMLIAPPLAAPRPGATRWSGSAWLIARGGGGAGGGTFGSGQLGGSQAGLRITYALDRARRLSAVARVSAPLHGAGREAAIGIEWRPSRLPIRLVGEERVSLDGGKNGPALGVIGGIDPTPIGHGFRLEAYGQAGAIDRDGIEGFADGAARIARPLASLAGVKLDIGGGAWGGAQRDAARLDIGPSIGARIPIGPLPVRLTLDWRQRVAGHARPGSGLAVSLGADF